jgi:hypothetical protein
MDGAPELLTAACSSNQLTPLGLARAEGTAMNSDVTIAKQIARQIARPELRIGILNRLFKCITHLTASFCPISFLLTIPILLRGLLPLRMNAYQHWESYLEEA